MLHSVSMTDFFHPHEACDDDPEEGFTYGVGNHACPLTNEEKKRYTAHQTPPLPEPPAFPPDDPVLIAAPVAMAASCAFMLPVATGPNAVVFASGEIRVPQMVKAGFFGNLAGIAIITLLAYWLTPLLFAGG